MISGEMIKASYQEATYQRKAGTSSSYYWQSGSRILPNRASITMENEVTKVARKGRNLLHPVAGQFLGQFTRKEESPLKQNKPFHVRTQIWQDEDYPQFIGYGTTGISDAEGRVTDRSDTGDLLVFYSEDTDWQTIRIFIFAGMGKNPEHRDSAMRYASKLINGVE
ncbi:MAG: hypothetical protein KIC64_04970 [Prevotella buccae]|uniref:hypothetical protein n=1 Tax=Segatella buccae TaxID=28126 RepID=UPI0012DDCFC0|nr:hypothetical protein [Segatella buccae]MBS5895159.1 hypothetical protein [Segatella buccae]